MTLAWAPPAGWLAAAIVLALTPAAAWLTVRIARGFGAATPAGAAAGGALAIAMSATVAAPSPAWLAASVALGWTLAALAWIDLRVFRLPDLLTLPLIVGGLAQAAWLEPDALTARAVGAAVGYGALAALAWLYRRRRGLDGLGMGDGKLLAAAGSWLGWSALPAVVGGAAVAGLLWMLVAARGRRLDPLAPVAFGVPLCLATWIGWLWRLGGG